MPLRGRQKGGVDIEFLRCSRALSKPLVGASLLRNSGRCPPFCLTLHRSLLRLSPPRRPCCFLCAFRRSAGTLSAGQPPIRKWFALKANPRKRRLRQAGAGRADTRTRGSEGVVGVGESPYATRRFAQARPTKRSLLSRRESRNDHRSVRVGRRVGRPAPVCASLMQEFFSLLHFLCRFQLWYNTRPNNR